MPLNLRLSRAVVVTAAASVLPAASPLPLAVLTYRPNGKLISLPVRAQTGETLWFILDSGARQTTYDAQLAEQLHLNVVAKGIGAGVGHGTFEQGRGAPVNLRLGPINFHVVNPAIIDLRNTGVQDHYDGLIGADLFQLYVVRIDPTSHTVSLYDPRSFTYNGPGAGVPITAPENRLYINVTLTLDNGGSVTHQVRVDTGSEDAVSDNFVRQSKVHRRALQGVGLGRPFVDESGVFGAVRIGPYVIRNAWGASNEHPAIGMEMLRRFTTLFDLPANKLYLAPNKNFSDPVPAPAP